MVIKAVMWQCEDDCDCWEPRIIEYSKVYYGHRDWKPPMILAQGTFTSEPTRNQIKALWRQLLFLARKYKAVNTNEIKTQGEL